MDWLTLVNGVVASAIWPIVLLIIAFMFWTPVWNAIERIRSVGPTGAVLDPHRSADQPTKSEAQSTELKISESALPAYRVLLPFARESYYQAAAVRAVAQSLEQSEARDIVASEYVLEITMLRLYIFIYRSQYDLLVHLVNRGGTAPLEDAEKIFLEAKERFPDYHASRSFNDWLIFLINFNAVSSDGTNIKLREIGEMFPSYLAQNRYFPPPFF